MNDSLFAISVGYDTSCALTSNPSFGSSSTIYDRKTGRAIDISTGLPLEEGDGTAGSHEFNRVVKGQMELTIQKMKEEGAWNRSCEVAYDPENLNFYLSGVALRSNSIAVELSITHHVDQACQFTTIIPLERFLPVAKPGSILEELAKAAAKNNAQE